MLEIVLDLRAHCIETATKRLYNRLLSEYFHSKGAKTEMEEKLALLQKALSNFDFPYLRSAHVELAVNRSAHIVLADMGDRLPGIVINNTSIDTKAHIRK